MKGVGMDSMNIKPISDRAVSYKVKRTPGKGI